LRCSWKKELIDDKIRKYLFCPLPFGKGLLERGKEDRKIN
jgi:hypothetical protein